MYFMKEKVVVIGGGPAGIAASLYLARADLSPLIIAGSVPGGQLTRTSEVENYPGFESILGPELVERMRNHAEKFGSRFINANVKTILPHEKTLHVIVENGQRHETDSILIATGADAIWLNLPSEERLRCKGVSACATCDGFFFRQKTVGVVGGGDTAMEEALTLAKFAKKIYIIHRRDSFRASKIMQERVLKNPKIEVLWNNEVGEVLGENKVEGVKLQSKVQGLTSNVLQLDGLFIAIGHKPTTDFLKNTGILLDEKGYVITSGVAAWKGAQQSLSPIAPFDFTYQFATSVAGVFAAGDVIDPYFRQAATAVGMGVAAALEIERYLREHSL